MLCPFESLMVADGSHDGEGQHQTFAIRDRRQRDSLDASPGS
jgi:hypothetical protein